MDLKDIDLNLLVVFDRLLAERRVSAVADSLGITQPAVSNALARLRKILHDPLFHRTTLGMQPTPFAQELATPVSSALKIIHGALNQKATFDPRTESRAFTIGMTDVGEIYFLPLLMQELARVAPHVTVSTVRSGVTNLKDEMEAGRVDLALGLISHLKAGFFQRRLFRMRYVCVFRQGHRLDKRRITINDFAQADHLVVLPPETGHGQVDETLERNRIRRKVRLTVPHFVTVGHLLQDSDMIATIPERVAHKLVEPFQLAYVAHPVKLPEIEINAFWHAKYHKDPANEWLRGVVVRVLAD